MFSILSDYIDLSVNLEFESFPYSSKLDEEIWNF